MAGLQPGHVFFGAGAAPRQSELSRKPSRYPGTTGWNVSPAKGTIRTRGGRDMNWDQIEGNWTKAKGKLRQQWGKLTDDDLTVINGKREELAGRLQERYGYQKDQAEKEIDDWMKKAS
jgi:uncharacterized protein YjbJ (UPF0337 family)